LSDAPVSTLPGIGPVTRSFLDEAGIGTVSDLRSLGAVEAYRRLEFLSPRRISLGTLHGLGAALRGCHWLDLPPDVKTFLKHEAKAVDEAFRKGASDRCRLG
jgi:DNA transformation protein and related proteins